MSDAEHYKRKKRREQFKKIGLNILVWVMVISFVGSIGAGAFMNAVNYPKVMKINGKLYRYKAGSTFNYILNQNQQQNSKRFKDKVSPQLIRNYSINQSIQDLLSMGLLYQFGEKEGGIRPSKKAVQNMMRYTAGGRLPSNPQDGFIEFIEMEYMRSALSGKSGDILNAISPVTTAELFSYFDLVNYTVQTEVVWLDMTNYLSGRLSDKELSDYYQANLKTYTTEVSVEDLTVKSKKKSVEILNFARENGWDEAVKMYATNKGIEHIASVVLNNSGDTVKRFELMNGLKAGTLPESSLYEHGTYHIMRVESYPNFAKLDRSVQEQLRMDYLATNYQKVEQTAQGDLEKISSTLTGLLTKKSFKATAAQLGLKYALTAKLSPVDQRIRDVSGETLDLPLLTTEGYREYLFRGTPGVVSKVYKTPACMIAFKLKKRTFNSIQNYAEGIDRDVYLRYSTFKTRSVSQDWIRTLKKNAKFEIFHSDIKKIYE